MIEDYSFDSKNYSFEGGETTMLNDQLEDQFAISLSSFKENCMDNRGLFNKQK